MTEVVLAERKRTRGDGPAILISNLHKSYQKKEVLHGLNLEVNSGELFGLIGPDGAGKTTTLQIISGVMRCDEGNLVVLGKKPQEAKKALGYVTQQFSLYPDLSIEENLRYVAGTHDVPADEYQHQQSRYLQLMGLSQFGDRLVSQLSGGMKQKAALCAALILRPELILLDEPTTGVDPLSRREFWELIDKFRNERPTTIVVATPYWDEAERCNRIAMMRDGSIEICGTPSELKSSLEVGRLELQTTDDNKAMGLLSKNMRSSSSGIEDLELLGDHINLLAKNPEQAKSQIKEHLSENGLTVKSISLQEPSIEDVYIMHMKSKGETPESVKVLEQESTERKNGVAIRAHKLQKSFGNFTAVKNFNLEIEYGEIYGLLGANGAGKTTAIKMICGLQRPGSGEVKLAEHSPDLKNGKLRKAIGYMSQKNSLYADLTVLENLQFYSSIYEIELSKRQERIEWVTAACGLQGREDDLVDRLPEGWKQRVAFAAAIMHQPEILFLDEPSSGVDAIARRELWAIIRQLAERGTAILVTTHFLDEAEYCNRLGLMVAGEVVVEGASRDLKEKERTDSLDDAFIKIVRRKSKEEED